jgi:hypothetical protein
MLRMVLGVVHNPRRVVAEASLRRPCLLQVHTPVYGNTSSFLTEGVSSFACSVAMYTR